MCKYGFPTVPIRPDQQHKHWCFALEIAEGDTAIDELCMVSTNLESNTERPCSHVRKTASATFTPSPA